MISEHGINKMSIFRIFGSVFVVLMLLYLLRSPKKVLSINLMIKNILTVIMTSLKHSMLRNHFSLLLANKRTGNFNWAIKDSL